MQMICTVFGLFCEFLTIFVRGVNWIFVDHYGKAEMVRIAQIGNSSTISLTVELFPIYAIRAKNGK